MMSPERFRGGVLTREQASNSSNFNQVRAPALGQHGAENELHVPELQCETRQLCHAAGHGRLSCCARWAAVYKVPLSTWRGCF